MKNLDIVSLQNIRRIYELAKFNENHWGKSKIFTLTVLGIVVVSLTIFGSLYVSDDYVPSDTLANNNNGKASN